MRIIVFAPHNDDEVLGVGGTMAKYSKEGHEVFVCEITAWLENEEMTNELQRQALKAHNILGVKDTFFLNLPVVHLKETDTHIKNQKISNIVNKVKPDVAFIPHIGDMHVDHAETAMAAMVAMRPVSCIQLKSIFTYETLSETEWNIPSIQNAFMPNAWSDISDTIDLKLEAMKCFTSQLRDFPHPRSLKAIKVLANLRGSTINTEYAEAFSVIRHKI